MGYIRYSAGCFDVYVDPNKFYVVCTVLDNAKYRVEPIYFALPNQ